MAAELRGETKGNVCMVEGSLDTKTKVLVSIETSPGQKLSVDEREKLDQDPAWRKDRNWFWSKADRVLIKVNGDPVLVSDSAFEGIYGVAFIIVKRQHGSIRIQVSGGDAGSAFDVFYTVQASKRMKGHYRLTERVRRLGEFPDDVWEKTIYHNTVWDDPYM
jgi:hypothetical protein